MSCEHGNPHAGCDLCDAIDAAYKSGYIAGGIAALSQPQERAGSEAGGVLHPCIETKEGAEACPWHALYMALNRHVTGLFDAGRASDATQVGRSAMWIRCVFQGPPPEGYSDWNQWIGAATKMGATIRASAPEDWAEAK